MGAHADASWSAYSSRSPADARVVPPDASTILDYVTFDGIDYIRWAEEPGRALTSSDLGPEFATVECAFGDGAQPCACGLDAAAAFLPAGTRMHAVRGHATGFRLAAVWRDRIFLYQAWRSARAKRGADLFDIAGKVVAIDVQRAEVTPPTLGRAFFVETGELMGGVVLPPEFRAVLERRLGP